MVLLQDLPTNNANWAGEETQERTDEDGASYLQIEFFNVLLSLQKFYESRDWGDTDESNWVVRFEEEPQYLLNDWTARLKRIREILSLKVGEGDWENGHISLSYRIF